MRSALLDLQLFVCVVDGATVSAGAAAVHISRAVAGGRLRALESRLGATLLERGPDGLAVTPAGAAVLGHARRVLRQLEALRSELAAHRDGSRGRVRVLGNTSACREALPGCLPSFLRERPEVAIDLEELSSEAILEAVAAGHAELGLVSDAVDRRGLPQRTLRADPLVLVVPVGHRLVGRSSLRLDELLDETSVGLPADSALQSHIDAHALRHGRFLGYRLRVNGLDQLCRLILVARSFDRLAPTAQALVRHLLRPRPAAA